MKDYKCILSKCPTAARLNFRRLVIASVILCLILPLLAAGQPLTIISDPYSPLDGKIVGFTIDVIKLLLERTGIQGKFEMYPWARAYKMAQEEKDILIFLSHQRAGL